MSDQAAENEVEVACPVCRQEMFAPAEMIGSKTTCPRCDQVFVISTVPEAVKPHQVILTTTSSVDGFAVKIYLGIVSAQAVMGVNALRDLMASFTDIIGGRSDTMERALQQARQIALGELQQKAARMGADAVLGIKLDVETLGATNGMMMMMATGTAVSLRPAEPMA